MVVSSDVLERPGRLRAIGTLIPILLVALPSTTLMWSVLQSSASKEGLVSVSYQAALLRSGALALLITVASVLVGLPCGVFSAVYEFRGRRALLALAGLPLLLPSFLNALGWSMLTLRLAPNASAVLSGFPGAFLAHFPEGSALVLFASFGAARGLSQSQLDAARIADGERGALVTTCRYAGVPAILAAILAGVLSLSDPGPSQVFGLRTAASEILTTFSSRYDFAEAGRQCLVLSVVVLLVVIPV
ncbi:MAG: hypothetical protein HYR85_18085, partial [Planctomycetes bacterium]|nr:hypothetical protein [Planctomycetota bacterium]